MAKTVKIPRFLINTWHLLPDDKGEIVSIISFLNENLNLRIELNSFIDSTKETGSKISNYEDLTSMDVYNYLLLCGLHKSKITCDHLANSKLPMFRFVRERP